MAVQVTQNSKIKWIKISFGLSILLFLTKFLAYYFTNSNAILSDALESVVNVLASGFAFYSVYLSAKPRDGNHPYGHGKIEYFASGFEGAMIVVAGIWIVVEAIGRLINQQQIETIGLGSLLVALTVGLNLVVGFYLKKVGTEARSEVLLAEGKHLMTDSYSSIVVLFGLGITSWTHNPIFDAIASLVLSIVIFYNGYVLIRRAVAALMDETDVEVLGQVVEIINTHKKDEWIDVHNLRVQKYGSDLHIDCHLTLPYFWDLKKVHQTVHEFEETLTKNTTGETEIFIHSDPCLSDCCRFCKLECQKRSSAHEQEIDWSVEKLIKNQKLFVEG